MVKFQLKTEKNSLESEVAKLKEEATKKPVEESLAIGGTAISVAKDLKHGKKLWDEMAKKDERIEELER